MLAHLMLLLRCTKIVLEQTGAGAFLNTLGLGDLQAQMVQFAQGDSELTAGMKAKIVDLVRLLVSMD